MPSPPADWVDVERSATEQATLDGTFPVAGFSRLCEALADTRGEASARFQFYRVAGRVALDGAVEATVTLTCQRCLAPMAWPLAGRMDLVFVAEAADLDGADPDGELPQGLEPALAPQGRASLAALVEDELLLALPLVARHEDLADCARAGLDTEALVREDEVRSDEDTVQRPFANLRDWLKE